MPEVWIHHLDGGIGHANPPKTKFFKVFKMDDIFDASTVKLKGYKKYTSPHAFDDKLMSVLIPISEYCISNREFYDHAYSAIHKLKDKPNFWCIILVKYISPELDFIELGFAIGHD
jgi:hypothetical protein